MPVLYLTTDTFDGQGSDVKEKTDFAVPVRKGLLKSRKQSGTRPGGCGIGQV